MSIFRFSIFPKFKTAKILFFFCQRTFNIVVYTKLYLIHGTKQTKKMIWPKWNEIKLFIKWPKFRMKSFCVQLIEWGMQNVYSPKIIKGGLILYMRITLCHHAYCKRGYIPVNEINTFLLGMRIFNFIIDKWLYY